jgi:hypothetical protein
VELAQLWLALSAAPRSVWVLAVSPMGCVAAVLPALPASESPISGPDVHARRAPRGEFFGTLWPETLPSFRALTAGGKTRAGDNRRSDMRVGLLASFGPPRTGQCSGFICSL